MLAYSSHSPLLSSPPPSYIPEFLWFQGFVNKFCWMCCGLSHVDAHSCGKLGFNSCVCYWFFTQLQWICVRLCINLHLVHNSKTHQISFRLEGEQTQTNKKINYYQKNWTKKQSFSPAEGFSLLCLSSICCEWWLTGRFPLVSCKSCVHHLFCVHHLLLLQHLPSWRQSFLIWLGIKDI